MKTIFLLLFMSLSLQSSAAIIVIHGQLSPLESRGDLYYLPQTYVISPDTTNLFITMDGLNKVCFLNTAPSLLEEVSQVNLFMNGIKTEWNCFPYKTTVFEVRP